ncbi:MAG: lysophospholipid acyltransferase family protein, partial [Gemmatimonadota bacterium]
ERGSERGSVRPARPFVPTGFRDARPPGARHRVEYALFALLRAIITLLPVRVAEAVGGWVGRLGYPLGVRRAVALANLRIAFPDADEGWMRTTARAAYGYIGREMITMLRLPELAPEAIRGRTRFPDEALFRAAMAEGRGVVMVAGHFGNWEVAAAGLAARGYPTDVIVRRQSNPLFNRLILATRRSLGVGLIDLERAHREALAALRAGHVVCFGADQNAGRTGVFVPYFGRLASTYRGPAVMALRTGAPVFLGMPLRMPDGSYELRIRAVQVDREGPQEAVVERITAAFTRGLEEAVRATPEQYLWQHRRWRSRPPEEQGTPNEV